MSLVNGGNSSNSENVKFVSYTGTYPNLCGGILTLIICGKEYVFGHDYSKFESWKTDGHNPSFWSSGGNCGFANDYSDSYVNSGSGKSMYQNCQRKLNSMRRKLMRFSMKMSLMVVVVVAYRIKPFS